jgi:hypothetical protein
MPRATFKTTLHLGWQPTSHFTLPTWRCGAAKAHPAVFAAPLRARDYGRIAKGGDAAEALRVWQTAMRYPGVAALAVASLASTLIEPLQQAGADIAPFIIDVGGPSGTGKSVALGVMETMWGAPMSFMDTWQSSNGDLLKHASVLRNLPLLVNEAQSRSTRSGKADGLLDFVYAFHEGQRTQQGGYRQWHNLAVSTNEEPLFDLTRERHGAKARLLPLTRPLFGGVSDAARSDIAVLKGVGASNYGHIGPMFVTAMFPAAYRPTERGILAEGHTRWTEAVRTIARTTDVTSARVARYAGLIMLTAERINKMGTLPEVPTSDVLEVLVEAVCLVASRTNIAASSFVELCAHLRASPHAVIGLAYDGSEAPLAVWPTAPGEDGFVAARALHEWCMANGYAINDVLGQWAATHIVKMAATKAAERSAAAGDWINACQVSRQVLDRGRPQEALGYALASSAFGA